MVLISLLGYRADSGFDLKYLGLCRLTVVGWGHQRSQPGNAGGLTFLRLRPGAQQHTERGLALLRRDRGQFPAATFTQGLRATAPKGHRIQSFTKDKAEH